jgi:hypothetical protein
MQHRKPRSAIGQPDQPEAREGLAGHSGVAERLVVPMKSGNSEGGKEPQFETSAPSSEEREIG